MVHAVRLSDEQAHVLRALLGALQDLERDIGRPLFPQIYADQLRRRPVLRGAQRLSRRQLYEQQGGRCCYCGAALYPGRTTKAQKRASKPGDEFVPAEIDHAQPRSRAGKDERHNYRLACVHCNRHKGVLTEEEYRAVIAFRTGQATNRTPLASESAGSSYALEQAATGIHPHEAG
jgi:hypothetical protein